MLKFCIYGQKIELINRQNIADQQINGMAIVYVCHFVDENFLAIFLQIFLGNDHVFHPTERSDILVMDDEGNTFF